MYNAKIAGIITPELYFSRYAGGKDIFISFKNRLKFMALFGTIILGFVRNFGESIRNTECFGAALPIFCQNVKRSGHVRQSRDPGDAGPEGKASSPLLRVPARNLTRRFETAIPYKEAFPCGS